MQKYRIAAKQNNAEIWIYSEIGSYWDGITAKQFSEDMKQHKDAENILVHLNSPGGDVFDGVAIYNILLQHKAKVDVNIEGLAASIASVIAMAGDNIVMASNSMMMVHKAWGVSVGNASELRKTADMLEKVDETIINTYCKRKKCDRNTMQQLVDDETWMTAEEAMNYGLVDSIFGAVEVAAFDMSRFKYKNIPSHSGNAQDNRCKLARMNMKIRRKNG